MRPTAALAAGLLALLGVREVRAESYVTGTGFYYKERSTRVVAPSVNAHVELPKGWTVDGGILVDQVTSASGAFTATDEAFTEYRVQGTLALDYLLTRQLKLGLNGRASNESDYRSFLGGARGTFLFNDKLTAVGASVQYQSDALRQPGPSGIRRALKTVYLGLTGSQVLTPRLLLGATLNIQVLRGYLENQYRVEQHPDRRNDYSLGYFLRYRYGPWGLGVIFEQCGHYSSWQHKGLTSNLELYKTVTPWLDVVPRVRVHVQDAVFFIDRAEIPDPKNPGGDPIAVFTTDPSLAAMQTVTVGARLVIAPPVLDGLQINPAYYFMYQSTRYGNAHLAQVVLYYPFSIE